MENFELEDKQNYIYSLLDEIRNSLVGVDELEWEKFASNDGSFQLNDALDSVEFSLTELVTGLKAE